MAKIRIKQVRSSIKRPARQKATLKALGIRKLHQEVEPRPPRAAAPAARPPIMGMINKVRHLLEVAE